MPLRASTCPTCPDYPRCLDFQSTSSSTSLNSLSVREVDIHDINSLSRPRFTSFVAIARTVNTSTIILTITFVIAAVGVMLVYISSRWKKLSILLKASISLSCTALASLAAWDPLCQNRSHKREMQDTNREENTYPCKYYNCRWECLKKKLEGTLCV